MDGSILNFVTSIMNKKSIETKENMSFAELTTFGSGGTIKLVIYPDTTDKTVYAILQLQKLHIDYIVLGKGSNTLASDEAYEGVVVSTSKLNGIKFRKNTVRVQAGVSTVTLAKQLQQKGLSGGEFFACLPASVGGAVVTNAGCFNQDVNSVVVGVTVLHNGKVLKLSADKCKFAKRSSIFKNNGEYVVLEADFKFEKSTPQDVVNTVSQMRRKKSQSQPLNYRSAGCVLYHDKVAVSRLIDEAGLKGFQIGGAKVSEKHAGFVVNVDKAESKDIYLVIQHVKNTLFARYGITAKTEVCLVNFTKDDGNDVFAGS